MLLIVEYKKLSAAILICICMSSNYGTAFFQISPELRVNPSLQTTVCPLLGEPTSGVAAGSQWRKEKKREGIRSQIREDRRGRVHETGVRASECGWGLKKRGGEKQNLRGNKKDAGGWGEGDFWLRAYRENTRTTPHHIKPPSRRRKTHNNPPPPTSLSETTTHVSRKIIPPTRNYDSLFCPRFIPNGVTLSGICSTGLTGCASNLPTRGTTGPSLLPPKKGKKWQYIQKRVCSPPVAKLRSPLRSWKLWAQLRSRKSAGRGRAKRARGLGSDRSSRASPSLLSFYWVIKCSFCGGRVYSRN